MLSALCCGANSSWPPDDSGGCWWQQQRKQCSTPRSVQLRPNLLPMLCVYQLDHHFCFTDESCIKVSSNMQTDRQNSV